MKALATALTLGALLGPAGLTAQECQLQLRMAAGPTSSALLPTETLNLFSGDDRIITKNYIRQLENIGDHDITVDLAIGNQVATVGLIRVNDATVFVPTIALVGQQLTRVRCGQYATWGDAMDFVDELGTSAAQLGTQVRNRALVAVQEARDDARDIYDSALVANRTTLSEEWLAEEQVKWNEILEIAAGLERPRAITLAGDFPELDAAFKATNAYPGGLDDDMAIAQQRFQQLSADLQEFGAQTLDNAGFLASFAFDAARAFPELAAASAFTCSFNDAPVTTFQSELGIFQAAIATLDSQLGISDGLSQAMEMPAAVVTALEGLASGQVCGPDFDGMSSAAESDQDAFGDWRRRVAAARRQLPPDALRLLPEQNRRLQRAEANTQAAAAEYSRVMVETDQVYRESQTATRRVRDRRLNWQERHDAARTLRRSRPELQRRNAATRRLQQARAGEAAAARALVTGIRNVRSPVRGVAAFATVLADVPSTALTGPLMDQSESCFDDLMGAVDTIADVVIEAVPSISPELRGRLVEVAEAAEALARFPQSIGAPADESTTDYQQVRSDRPQFSPGPPPSLSTGEGSIDIPTPSAIMEMDPLVTVGELVTGVSEGFRSFTSNLSERLQESVTEFAAGAQSMSAEADAYGQDLARLQAALAGVATELAAQREPLGSRDNRAIQAVITAGAELVNVWAEVRSVSADIQDCAAAATSAVDQLDANLDARHDAYQRRLSDHLSEQVSPEVREAWEDAVAAVVQASSDLIAVREAMGAVVLTLSEGIIDVVAATRTVGFPDVNLVPAPPLVAGVPAPFPTLGDVPEALQQLVMLPSTLDPQLVAVQQAVQAYSNSAIAQAEAVGNLLSAADDLLPLDALGPRPTPIEQAVIDEEADRLASLTGLWVDAVVIMPTRVATAGPRAAANLLSVVRTDLQMKLRQAQDDVAELASCANTMGSVYAQVFTNPQGFQFSADLASDIAAAIQSSAADVLPDLQSLLNPLPGNLPSVATTFQKAAELVAEIQSTEATARADWEAYTANNRALLTEAESCINPWIPVTDIRDAWPDEFDPFEARFRFLAVTLTVEIG